MGKNISTQVLFPAATAVNAAANVDSEVIDTRKIEGDAIAVKFHDMSGTAPDIDVICLVCDSKDGTFVVPYDEDGNDISVVAAALAANRWVQYIPPLAPFMIFRLDGQAGSGADVVLGAKLIIQESA